jgi:hypothetical protein
MSGFVKRSFLVLVTSAAVLFYLRIDAAEIPALSPELSAEEQSGLATLKVAAQSFPKNLGPAPMDLSKDVRVTESRLPFGKPIEIELKPGPNGHLEGVVTVHRTALSNPVLLFEGFANFTSWGLPFWLFPSLERHGYVPVMRNSVPQLRYLELKQNHSEGSLLSERQLMTALKETASQLAHLDNVENLDMLLEKLGHSPAKIREFVIDAATFHGIELSEVSGTNGKEALVRYFQGLGTKYENLLSTSLPLAQKQMREMKRRWESKEKDKARNSAEAESEKLNDLVKRNDRAGVARLLETFVPFDLMEPVEKRLWQDWIEAIRHPDASQSVILYRGIDPQDKPQKVLDAKGEVTGYGFFSTVLSKNQGNYTRRLRSLVRSRQILGALGTAHFGNAAKPPTALESAPGLTMMMNNHAVAPIGSPFMSMTTSLNVARHFGKEGVVVARVDRRRLLVNHVGIGFEKEILLPLILFPDEVLRFETRKHIIIEPVPTLLMSLSASTGLPLSSNSAPDLEMEFNRLGNFMRQIMPKDSAESCQDIFK